MQRQILNFNNALADKCWRDGYYINEYNSVNLIFSERLK